MGLNQTTIALLGFVASLVAVWAETRSRNNGEDARERERDAGYWRESYQVAKAQLAAVEGRVDALQDGFDKLRAWCIEQAEALGAPSDPEPKKKEKKK